jgi:lysophospholipase L1-like esterase
VWHATRLLRLAPLLLLLLAVACSGPRSDEVYVLGDSLTVGAGGATDRELRERGADVVVVEADLGRTTGQGLEILATDAGDLPEAVLIALGTNDVYTATEADVDGWMRMAREIVGDRRLIWVNLHLQPEKNPDVPALARFEQLNLWLAAAAPRYDVELADWHSYAVEHGIETIQDGVHYDDDASAARAVFYAEVVTGS